ncbi:MAG: phosphatase PAP2 family protein [Actinomycetes bacterium]
MEESKYLALPDRSKAPRFAIAGVVVLACGLLLGILVAFQESWMNARELPISTWFRDLGLSSQWLTTLADWLSWIGSGARTVPIVLLVSLLLVMTKRWPWALFLLASSQLGFFVSNSVKYLVGRNRPPWGEFTARQAGTSFPSGHTFTGVAGWVAIGIIVLYIFPKRWSRAASAVIVTVGVLVGPSRVILARHWGTDVLGGWLLATGWLLLVWAAFLWLFQERLSVARAEPAGPAASAGPSELAESADPADQGSIIEKNKSN